MGLDPTPAEMYGFKVVQYPNVLRDFLYADVVGMLHETQNNSWGLPDPSAHAAAAYMKGQGIDSHFVIDSDTILQMQPLDRRVTTLRNNAGTPSTNGHAAQIEVCYFTSSIPYSWDKGTKDRVIAAMAYMSDFHGIAVRAPYDWPDATTSNLAMPWAARNARRVKAESRDDWYAEDGWWMHMEAPWQSPSYHWDIGACKRSELLTGVRALLGDEGGDDELKADERKWLKGAYDRAVHQEQEQVGLLIGLGLADRADYAQSFLNRPQVKAGITKGEFIKGVDE